jgi:hypothetical protein
VTLKYEKTFSGFSLQIAALSVKSRLVSNKMRVRIHQRAELEIKIGRLIKSMDYYCAVMGSIIRSSAECLKGRRSFLRRSEVEVD